MSEGGRNEGGQEEMEGGGVSEMRRMSGCMST